MSRECEIVVVSGLCVNVVEVDGGGYTPAAGNALAPDNKGEIGDTWNGTVWITLAPGSIEGDVPPAGAVAISTVLSLRSGDEERARLDAGGRLVVGATAAVAIGAGGQPAVQVQRAGSEASLAAVRFSADALGARAVLAKSRGAEVGTYTAVAANDEVGRLAWVSANGTDLENEIAYIAGLASAVASGTTAPGHIAFGTKAGTVLTEHMRLTSAGDLVIGNSNTTTANARLHINNTGAGNSFQVDDNTDPDVTPFIVDAFGRVIIGHSAVLSGITGFGQANWQYVGTTVQSMTTATFAYVAAATGAQIIGHKSRGATIGSHAAALSGDIALSLIGAVSDGDQFIRAGQISIEADANAADNNVPGRIRVLLTPPGSAALVEAARFDSSGKLGLGVTAPTVKLHVAGAHAAGAATMAIFSNDVTGTPAAGDGVRIALQCESAAGLNVAVGALRATYTDVTAASEDSDLTIALAVAGVETDVMCVKSTGHVLINGTQVLGPRKTGWTAATGTATRTTFATSTVTLAQLAERVKALMDDQISHGLIGT